jgi:4-alpha-glucanotransferase
MGLRELAAQCGVTTSHVDGLGRQIEATEASMLAVLRALGVAIDRAEDADGVLQQRLQVQARLVPPCLATSADEDCMLPVHCQPGDTLELTLTLETGATREWSTSVAENLVDDIAPVSLGILPMGYHQVMVRNGVQEARTFLLAAPAKAYGAPGQAKTWGLFAPLYALRRSRDYGVGDFACLRKLMDWADELGASFVGTLPLLAANYREDFQSSPYSPVSRLYWNELYLDLDALTARYPSPELNALLEADETKKNGKCLSELPLVDYAGTSAFRRSILECVARSAWQKDAAQLRSLAKSEPELHAYAAFRATTETSGTTWSSWKNARSQREIDELVYDEESYRYHLFSQWALDEQLRLLADHPCALYLDLSVGVSGSSFDVWRYQDDFVSGIDVGAPPDGLFEGGQNWALPPLHPERSREEGHQYFAGCVRAHMRHAGMLRIDHVMGLHRLYWVPSDLAATEGLYVSYPADELYAILLIESQRQECVLVGEDLGTVPEVVRPAMEAAGIHGLYVGQFSTEWRPEQQFLGLQRPSGSAVASLDTHDTATFGGWFDTTDLSIDPMTLMRAWTEELASGPAAALVITLEDLWLEREPQNRPGTGPEKPNWRHRIVRPLDEITADPDLNAWLQEVSRLRLQAQN